jgi:hypothetical protein
MENSGYENRKRHDLDLVWYQNRNVEEHTALIYRITIYECYDMICA